MDALTNTDGLYRSKNCYNAVLSSVRIIDDPVTEPVTLAEAKEYLLVTYDDRDAEIAAIISRCRKALEDDKWISIVSQSVNVILNNSLGGIELPYGPVVEVTEMLDSEGNVIEDTSYTLENFTIVAPRYDYLEVSYTAGYPVDEVPENLKQELLEMIDWIFFRKGSLAEGLAKISKSNSKRTWLV
jgi:hypothetical protein